MQNDLKELESSIFPLYQTTATEMSVLKANLSRNSQQLTLDLYKQREIWYREIDTVIEHFQTKLVKWNQITVQSFKNRRTTLDKK